MKTMYTDNDLQTAQLILAYLRRHPGAKDTVEGIARWWLLNERVEQTVDRIERALEWLIENDLIEENQLQGDLYSYTLKNGKQTQVDAALQRLMQQRIRS